MEEIFRTIPDFEDYQVSNKGRVISNIGKGSRFLKPQKDAMGYVHVRLFPKDPIFGRYEDGRGKIPKLEKVHRLVAMLFLPTPEGTEYVEINHIDGNKQNNDVTNLEWSTRKLNIQHAWDNGLRDNGLKKAAITRGIPVRITKLDGTVLYFPTQLLAAAELGVMPMTITKKADSGTFGRVGFMVERITEEENPLTYDEMYAMLEAAEEKLFAIHSKMKPKKYADREEGEYYKSYKK